MYITKMDPKLAEYKELIPGHIIMNPSSKEEFQVLQKPDDMIVLSAARQENYPYFRRDRYARAISAKIFDSVCEGYLLIGHVKSERTFSYRN